MKKSTKWSVFKLSLVLLVMLLIPLVGQKAFASTFSWDCHSDNSCHKYDWIWLFPSLSKDSPVTLEPDGSIRNDEDPRDIIQVSADPHRASDSSSTDVLGYIKTKSWNSKVATAIFTCESGLNPHSVGDQGTSIGVAQIHLPAHPKYNREKLFDYQYNIDAAYDIYVSNGSWRPWTCAKLLGYVK